MITNRVSVLVADTVLIVVTWKTLPDHHDIANYIAQGRVTKIKGLASIMLFSGESAFFVPPYRLSCLVTGMMYFT